MKEKCNKDFKSCVFGGEPDRYMYKCFLEPNFQNKKKLNKKKRIQSQNQNNYQKYIHCIELTK